MSCGVASGESSWFRALLLAPAVVGSVAAVFILTNVTSVGSGFIKLVGTRARNGRNTRNVRRQETGEQGLVGLRSAILGNGKQEIAKVFGPPHSAAVIGLGDTWYYSLRSNQKLAMAISFDAGQARKVEFFHPPA